MKRKIINITIIVAFILLLMGGACSASSLNMDKYLSKSDDGASVELLSIKNNITRYMESEGFNYNGMSTNGHSAYIVYDCKNNTNVQVSFNIQDFNSKASKLNAHSVSAVNETINGFNGLYYDNIQGELNTQNFVYDLPDSDSTIQVQLSQPSDYKISDFVKNW